MRTVLLGIGVVLGVGCAYGEVAVVASQQGKMKLHIATIDDQKKLDHVLETIMTDLSCPLQKKAGFAISTELLTSAPSTKYIKQWTEKDVPLLIFLSYDPRHDACEWRMYSTVNARMKTSKRVFRMGMSDATWGHAIAQTLWEALTGQPGIFMTKLAYCKRVHKHRDNNYMLLVGSPFQLGTQHDVVLVKRGAIMAPRWNNSIEHPLLLYSEATPENVRLVSTSMRGKRSLVSNFDGLNMLPSVAADGSKVIYCLSRDGSSQLYSYHPDITTGKMQLYRLTHNNGNNVSPVLLDNGDIVFCSDFQRTSPQICYYQAATKTIERITDGGYCSSPAYCPITKKIAYIKVIDGVMQVCVYDCTSREHTQLTFDQGDKDECTWSPCGNYIAYSLEAHGTSRIAVKNCITGEQFFKTSDHDYCIFPCWSPCFASDIMA